MFYHLKISIYVVENLTVTEFCYTHGSDGTYTFKTEVLCLDSNVQLVECLLPK